MITVIMTAEVSKMADYIICNGKIVNGKNEAPFEGNIIIEGSRIKEITKTTEFPSDFPTERILDAKGGYVTRDLLTSTDMETGRHWKTVTMNF